MVERKRGEEGGGEGGREGGREVEQTVVLLIFVERAELFCSAPQLPAWIPWIPLESTGF